MRRELLGYLLLTAGRMMSANRRWDGVVPERAVSTLQVHVLWLRRPLVAAGCDAAPAPVAAAGFTTAVLATVTVGLDLCSPLGRGGLTALFLIAAWR